MGVQQIEEIFSLVRTLFRSSQNMVFVRENDIRRGKIREEKICGILYVLCFAQLEIIPTLFFLWNLVTRL
jgi:hypothetical protein